MDGPFGKKGPPGACSRRENASSLRSGSSASPTSLSMRRSSNASRTSPDSSRILSDRQRNPSLDRPRPPGSRLQPGGMVSVLVYSLCVQTCAETSAPADVLAFTPTAKRYGSLVKSSWRIVSVGEPGLERPLLALTGEGREETERCPPPSSRGQPAPHAHRRHGVRAPGVASAWSPVSRGI